jgi:hypothetical protein
MGVVATRFEMLHRTSDLNDTEKRNVYTAINGNPEGKKPIRKVHT